ncbi:MAG: hypothetical protein IAI50_12140 [Candidatus Eremiobacteraeota bacterium]|nr:hypothetical protein [Candidatus Eremiobacteraeota bacterium]
MATEAQGLPRVKLGRIQWVRLVVVGIFVAFVAFRVGGDMTRIVWPLHVFDYRTDADGVIVAAPAKATPGSDRLFVGDRVRVDRIKPFDRKPGIARSGYSREDANRYLPIERNGRERVVHLHAVNESVAARATAVGRVLLILVVVGLAALLFIIKPSYPTAAIFAYCLGGSYPTAFSDVLFDNPWRQIPQWIGATLTGAAQPALLLFPLCLLYSDRRVQRTFAYIIGIVGLVLGTLNAYATWLLIYHGTPAKRFDDAYSMATTTIVAFTLVTFGLAFARTRGVDRQRIGLLALAFAVAGIARLVSDALYPARIEPWENGLLLALTGTPIVAVWFAVVRQNFFEIDFVVSRAIVYVALTAAVIGTISILEEIGTYLFVMNTDIAYGFIIVISMVVGSTTGKISETIEHFVDRFIFRDRHAQRQALELIAGYILDSENDEDVYRALLEDAPHALNLSFGGIFTRRKDGSFALDRSQHWPDDCVVRIASDDELVRSIHRLRGAVTFGGKETALIKRAFPGERLTFAAPLFFDRGVGAIVIYGSSVTGLDLDPDEREQLVRVVAHASLALGAIELNALRAEVDAARAVSSGV